MKHGMIILGVAVVCATLAALAGYVAYDQVNERRARTLITSESVLERVQDQYFVVTKTVIVDQESNMVVDKGSDWSNFWWGQTIEAKGRVRVDIGVDLSGLSQEDVVIDHEAKTITLNMPPATILDASQYGDIEVQSTRGVLKFLLENDPNGDYNIAKQQLVNDAIAAVQSDATLFEDARANAGNLLRVILEPFGYNVVTRQ